MRRQGGEFGLDGSVMSVIGTDQNPVPCPAAGFGGLNQQEHLTFEEVRRKAAEHWLGEEGGVLGKRFENPLVLELLHVFLARARKSLHVLEGLLTFRADFVDQLRVHHDALL